jgi:hypothetical protein
LSERDEPTGRSLEEAKQRVTDRLLPLDFISGVGSRQGNLTIYLARTLHPDERQKVGKILDAEAPGKPVEFVTSGEFKAR